MKETAPAHQYYPRDFQSETFSMSAEEAGIYSWLRCFCWIDGSIPANVEELAKMCRVRTNLMRSAWKKMEKFFHKRGENFFHSRLEEIREEQVKYREAQQLSGKAGAEKRWGRHRVAIVSPMANGMAKNSSASASASASAIEDKNLLCENTTRTGEKSPYTPRWFEEQHGRFYDTFWRKVNRKESCRAFEKRVRSLVKTGLTYEQSVEFLIAKSLEDRKRFEDTEEWHWRQKLHPATWLNGERWQDEAPQSPFKESLFREVL